MVVQWLFNGCHHALWSLVSAESMNAIRFLLRRGRDFAWNEWNGVNGSGMGVNGSGMGVNGREWGKRLPAFLMKFLGQIKAIT